MSGIANYVGGYKRISATGNVSPIATKLLGVFVTSSSSGTFTIYDSATTTTSAQITGTVSATAGTWYTIPAAAVNGLYIVVSGTLDATVIYA
jgi:hypothetical protein